MIVQMPFSCPLFLELGSRPLLFKRFGSAPENNLKMSEIICISLFYVKISQITILIYGNAYLYTVNCTYFTKCSTLISFYNIMIKCIMCDYKLVYTINSFHSLKLLNSTNLQSQLLLFYFLTGMRLILMKTPLQTRYV